MPPSCSSWTIPIADGPVASNQQVMPAVKTAVAVGFCVAQAAEALFEAGKAADLIIVNFWIVIDRAPCIHRFAGRTLRYFASDEDIRAD